METRIECVSNHDHLYLIREINKVQAYGSESFMFRGQLIKENVTLS